MTLGITVHVIDITQGLPAKGMKVELFVLEGQNRKLAEGNLCADGRLNHHPITHGQDVEPGIYEMIFHVGDFYRSIGYPLPDPPLLDRVPFRFGVGHALPHYHLPLKISPWGLMLYCSRC